MKNLRLALRSLLHFRLYTIINMLGLALALACVIVIFRYVYNEITIDRAFEKVDRLFVTVEEDSNFIGEKSFSRVYTQIWMRVEGPEEISPDNLEFDPGVEMRTRFSFFPEEKEQITVNGQRINANVLAADTNFFRILDFPVVQGSVDLQRPENAVITRSFARKIFGNEDPMGKQIGHSVGQQVTVAGVIDDSEFRTSLHFDLIVSNLLSPALYLGRQTLLLLYPEQDYKQINQKFDYFIEKSGSWRGDSRYQLLPLTEVYFSPIKDSTGTFLQGNRTTVIVLGIVGILILVVGVFNFMNIYTAVVLRRGREFGMKKVFGAPGWQVFGQLWAENAIMIGLALIIALALTELMNPMIRNFLGFDQLPFVAFDLLLSLGLFLVIPLITTVIPFWRYNYSTPVTSLRSVGKTGGRSTGRRFFLGFQYAITLVMIMVSLSYLKQLRFMLNLEPGFRTENIIQAVFQRRDADYGLRASSATEGEAFRQSRRNQFNEISQRLTASPLITAWTRGVNPIDIGMSYNYQLPGGDPQTMTMARTTGAWMKTFEPELVEGRLWDDEIDSENDHTLILSESAMRHFGITDYREAIIQHLDEKLSWDPALETMTSTEVPVDHRIIGVVRDFAFPHLRRQKAPFVYTHFSGFDDEPILATFVPGKEKEAIEFLRQVHAETVGGEFTYTFVEDEYQALYKEDRKVATVYSIFTAIAILISALGLFSISLFDVQQRFKEIAIRKVNGATTGVIINLLLRRYMILLGISFVIAVPVAWFAIQRYLENFAYKTAVSWWIFALALLITAGVSLLTLIHQTRRAAATNPADVIRSE